jgi:hypothetical protein
MLARINRPQQPPQFFVGFLPGATHRRCDDLALACRRIAAEVVAEFE